MKCNAFAILPPPKLWKAWLPGCFHSSSVRSGAGTTCYAAMCAVGLGLAPDMIRRSQLQLGAKARARLTSKTWLPACRQRHLMPWSRWDLVLSARIPDAVAAHEVPVQGARIIALQMNVGLPGNKAVENAAQGKGSQIKPQMGVPDGSALAEGGQASRHIQHTRHGQQNNIYKSPSARGSASVQLAQEGFYVVIGALCVHLRPLLPLSFHLPCKAPATSKRSCNWPPPQNRTRHSTCCSPTL